VRNVSGPADSALVRAVQALARARVDFVVVGVQGINFYAKDASHVVVTADVDVFLPPRADALRQALAALKGAGFEFFSRGEPFLDVEDLAILSNVVRSGANVVAKDAAGTTVDLMLSGGGMTFEDLAADATTFRIDDVEIRVGRLEKLLRSKEFAGRAKDVEFLRMFAARMRDEVGE
jgi:hypothetical protein